MATQYSAVRESERAADRKLRVLREAVERRRERQAGSGDRDTRERSEG